MSANTISTLSYSGTTQVATVTSTYGIPVTAHVWGAGGGSSDAHAGAGGGYSQINFVANPGDILTVAVGQGGGAGGVTAPPPAPPITWTTRSAGCDTTLYPGYQFNQAFYVVPVQLINTYGVWNTPSGIGTNGQTQVWTWSSVYFPVSAYYTIQGSSYANYNTINIDGVPVLSDTQGNLYPVQANVYVTSGYHSISITTTYNDRRQRTAASVAYTINQANPPKITATPTGLPGASYIGLLFNSRFPPPNQAATVYALGNGDAFLDQWGVWGPDQNDISFARTYTINFPTTARVIFKMASSMIATLSLDGNTILTSSPALPWETGVYETFVDVTGGTHTISFSGTGSVGALNRIGVIFGTGDQTSFAGGRGGISEPSSTQGFGGGGGGATILSLNGVVIGVGAGGGGGATMDPSNLTTTTTKYTGSTANQPFSGGFNNGQPPVVIVPGTSGYYIKQRIVYNDVGNILQTIDDGYIVIVNGNIVYQNQYGSGATPPPSNVAQKTTLVGNSWYSGTPGPYAQIDVVQCWNFDYFSLNTSAITDAKTNGENGQDVVGRAGYTLGGGGGGGGGGARGGNGGAAVSGANGVATGNGVTGGYTGHNGLSLGDIKVGPTGRLPYTNEYYPYGGVAEGGTAKSTVIRYIGSTATDPFHSVIVPGTSGYYIRNTGISGGSNSIIGYSVVVNGVVVYQSDGGSAQAPPATLAVKQGYIGLSYNQTFDVGGIPHYENVECFSFDYITAAFKTGGNGAVVFEFQTGGGATVKDNGQWKSVTDIYVKDNGSWQPVLITYINDNGTWKPIKGAEPPTFSPVNAAFGALVRPYSGGTLLAPPPPAPDYSAVSTTGYGSSDMF